MDLICIWSGVWEDKSVIHMSVCMRAFAVGMVVLSLGVLGLALGSESGPKIAIYFTNRHGKSRKHANIACGQFLRKLWTFLDKQQYFDSFYPSMATSLYYYPQLIHFWMKISDKMEKIQFYALLYSKKL